jgi:hypothetical protein
VLDADLSAVSETNLPEDLKRRQAETNPARVARPTAAERAVPDAMEKHFPGFRAIFAIQGVAPGLLDTWVEELP